MKNIPTFLFICFLGSGCDNNQRKEAISNIASEEMNKNYPLLIEGGTMVVYQFGHMTADQGLKLCCDTMPYPPGGLHLPDSIKLRLSIK
jgi:hypothetical protein